MIREPSIELGSRHREHHVKGEACDLMHEDQGFAGILAGAFFWSRTS